MLQPEPYEHDAPTSPLQLPRGGLGGHAGGGGGHVRMTQLHAPLRHVHSGPHCVPNVHCWSPWQNEPMGGGEAGHVADASAHNRVVHAH
jgi:hypothetical protein